MATGTDVQPFDFTEDKDLIKDLSILADKTMHTYNRVTIGKGRF
ncbi:MAG: hypothetical protein QW776_04810 [Candidatus Nitrosocaldus sp.]